VDSASRFVPAFSLQEQAFVPASASPRVFARAPRYFASPAAVLQASVPVVRRAFRLDE
jgi:hypothetical protein